MKREEASLHSRGGVNETQFLALPVPQMPTSQKTPSPSSSSSSLPSSPGVNDVINAGNVSRNRGQSLTQRKLTRQRKLRHVTDDEVGLQLRGRSRSSPGSPESSWKYRSAGGSDYRSSSAVPKPLPLPDLCLARRPESSSWNSSGAGHLGSPEEGPGSVLGRKDTDPAAKISVKSSSGYHQDVRGRSHFMPRRSNTVDFFPSHLPSNSDKSLNDRPRGIFEDLKIKSPIYNLRVNVFPGSAPESDFSSPAVSPQRSKSGDPSSFWTPEEFQGWLASEVPDFGRLHGSSSPVSPVSPVNNSRTPDRSPPLSPTAQSPYLNSKSPSRFSFPVHQKLVGENSKERLESNSLVNAHPLPLPPRAISLPQPSMPSPPVVIHHAENPAALSKKGQWQKGKLIGRGTFGSVYVGTNRETGASCAMKEVDIIPGDPKSAECIKQLEQEIMVLCNLKHPNIVQYYGSEIVDDHFYIYLEYVYPGSINKYINDHHGAITESVVRNFTRHILCGLAYLHSTKKIHRDIKCANLLVDASGTVKLADFGMAKHLTGLSYELSLKGSPYWMAPEVMMAVMKKDADPDLALAVDIWSLGCTIIEMFTGKPPWYKFEGPQAMFKALNQNPPIPETLSQEGKDFLCCCFRRNPAERPSAAKLLEHPFVRNSVDQNLSVSMQTFSKMNLTDDKSHSLNDYAITSTSPGGHIRFGKMSCPSGTCQICYTENVNCAAASHRSLEVVRSSSAKQLFYGSHSFSPVANASNNMPLGAINNHPCAILRTHGREVPHI